MNRVADSMKLAIVNLVGTCIALLTFRTRHSDAGLVWTLVFILPLLVLTMFFSIRELVKGQRRLQALIAVAISAPPLLLLMSVRLG
jgi:hypothetical protein